MTDRTRLVLLNSPHNPTGKVFSRAELELVAALCRDHDLVALTDEVYEHLVFDGEHVPLATLPGMAERTLAISSLGKTFSVTGWKVGWATGPAELVAGVRAAKQYLSFAGATPFQHAGAAALALGDGFYAGLGEAFKAKRDRLCAGLAAAGLRPLPPPGRTSSTRRSTATERRSAASCPSGPAWWRSPPASSTTIPRRAARSCASRSASARR